MLFFLGHCILFKGSEYASTAVATKLGRKGGSRPSGQWAEFIVWSVLPIVEQILKALIPF